MWERHEVHSKPPMLYPWDKSLSHWHKRVKHIVFKIQVKQFFHLGEGNFKKSPLLMRKGRKIPKSHIIRNYSLGKE